MATPEFNPLKLDVPAFARAGAPLEGGWPLSELPRLRAGVPAEARDLPTLPIRWRVQGELKPQAGGAAEIWLHLTARAELPLQCQRCLQPVQETVEVNRLVRFVADEETAAELDAELEEDVLVHSRQFDLRWWVEDELILALPLVPKHEACPQPLAVPSEPVPVGARERQAAEFAEADEPVRPNPFAALAALKKPPPSSEH